MLDTTIKEVIGLIVAENMVWSHYSALTRLFSIGVSPSGFNLFTIQFNFDNRISLGEFCNENTLKNQANMKCDSFEAEPGFYF